MKELIGHIESLLLTNNCVIVPDFGGFIAFNVPAKWNEQKNAFDPPVRTVGFNPQLKLNDGLVVQAYMSAYGTNFPDASKRVSKAARELKSHLMNQGIIELQGLGTLRVALDGSYHFVPFIDGLNSPGLYGLGELKFPLLVESKSLITENRKKPVQSRITPAREPETIPEMDERRRRPGAIVWRVAVASAAAVALFFSLSTPVGNIDQLGYQRAQVVASDLFVKPVQAEPVKRKPNLVLPEAGRMAFEEKGETSAETDLLVVDTEPPEKAIPETKAPAKPVSRDSFFIIVGAFSKETAAQTTVEKLRTQGFPKASVMSNSRVYKVCIASYSREEEAVKALRQFRAGQYEDAWIFKKK